MVDFPLICFGKAVDFYSWGWTSIIKAETKHIYNFKEKYAKNKRKSKVENPTVFLRKYIFSLQKEKLTVPWTLKSDSDAISLSSSNVADVAEGFAELKTKFKNAFNLTKQI